MFTVAFSLARLRAAAQPELAAAALAAVGAQGGRTLLVSGASGRELAERLAELGCRADLLAGSCRGARRVELLARHQVSVLVAGRPVELAAARSAGAVGYPGSLAAFPGWLAEHLLAVRLQALGDILAGLPSVLVAFSGGADSAFLLAAAVRALGTERVGALTAVSPSLPAAELQAAREFAAWLGVAHLTPPTAELDRAGYRANGPQRCYFCKSELIEVAARLAVEQGYRALATGTNADDARAGFRPGIRAAAERGALTPLLDAGLTKAQVRAASRQWGLRTWDKPAAACLSSRVAYGISITPGRLARVEQAELALRAALREANLACRNLRVRDLGDVARVEVDAELVGQLARRPDLLATVAGFASVQLDPRGFRSGSMNEALSGAAN